MYNRFCTTPSKGMYIGERRYNEDNADNNVLYNRASSMATEQGKGSPLLRAPFVLLAVLVGLWPHGHKYIQWLLITLGVLINTYILTGNFAVYCICGELSANLTSTLNPWLCYSNPSYNRTISADVFQSILLVRAMFSAAMLLGYVLMVHGVMTALPVNKHTMTLNAATSFLTRKQWLKINLDILLVFVIWLVYIIFRHSYHNKKFLPQDNYVLWLSMGDLLFWIYIGTPCWAFTIITYALGSLINGCFEEIKRLHGDIDDVVEIYSTLCEYIFNTVHVLRYWFVQQWVTYGVIVILEIAIGIKSAHVFPKEDGQVSFWIFSLTGFSFVVHSFLYPTLLAVSLTNQCEQLLERINGTTDWTVHHPFARRRTINEFLVFANQVQCGFRVNRLTLGSGLAWMSVFCSGLGLILKLL